MKTQPTLKVLVSTTETQKVRSSDFCWVPEGELVHMSSPCDADGDNIDGGCGCQRSFSGMLCHKATTTAKVIELNMTRAEYVRSLRKSYDDGGWTQLMGVPTIQWHVSEEARLLLKTAKAYDMGTIIEKRGPHLQPRTGSTKTS